MIKFEHDVVRQHCSLDVGEALQDMIDLWVLGMYCCKFFIDFSLILLLIEAKLSHALTHLVSEL